jgi:hypothetical protein
MSRATRFLSVGRNEKTIWIKNTPEVCSKKYDQFVTIRVYIQLWKWRNGRFSLVNVFQLKFEFRLDSDPGP